MSSSNESTTASYSDSHLDVRYVKNASDLPIEGRAIVVNVSNEAAVFAGPTDGSGPEDGYIMPWKSTVLRGTKLRRAQSVVILEWRQTLNFGGLLNSPNWGHYSHVEQDFPKDVPLWRSKQDSLGKVELDPVLFTHQTAGGPGKPASFELKVNLWFTPAETDCLIHTGHLFLEVHSQLYGQGRMQKFFEKDVGTLYEDVVMSPGFTHEPFLAVKPGGGFNYPWHRYYADTDCIWMAIELHREAATPAA